MSDPAKSSGSGPAPSFQPHHLTLTQADQDIIKSFLSSVPAGFPLSPGAALAELSNFSPLSPSLPSTNYHFSLSPARNQDPPSPRHVPVDPQRYPHKAVQSPKRQPSQQRSSLAGFQSLGSPKRPTGVSLQSPQRAGVSRNHSPDLVRPRSPLPLEFNQLRKEAFSSPAWSPQRQSDSPTYQLQTLSRARPGPSHSTYTSYLSPHHQSQLFEHEMGQDIGLKRNLDSLVHSDTSAHTDNFKKPRHSYSPPHAHSSPPRQIVDFSPLPLPSVGSYSPRRSYFNPPHPNPYSPVNPPAPYSPRRINPTPYSPPRLTETDHKYYGSVPSPVHHPSSPSQLTHPPSPSRNLELSPSSNTLYPDEKTRDSVIEPLDLDTHHQQDLLQTLPPQKSKPLTETVNKRLGISKNKAKSKNRRSPGASQGVKDKKPPPVEGETSSTQLECNLSEVSAKLEKNCGCEQKCFSGLDSEFVWRHRCNIAELSKGEHDMYLMGVMMASLVNPRATTKRKERQRNRNKYIFQGKEICQEAFLYLENVTIYQLKSIRKHVTEAGVVPRVHRNTGKKAHNVLELDHYQLAHRFVEDILEKEKGSGGGGARKKTFLADLTCKKLHSSYLKYFADLGYFKTMAYSTFRSFVHQRFPQLKFTSRETVVIESGVSINVASNNRKDTVLSIKTETHRSFD